MSPSLTSVRLARAVVLVGADGRLGPLLPPGTADRTADLLEAAGELKPFMRRLWQHRSYRQLLNKLLQKVGAGQLVHLALRKRFFDDELRQALAEGASQVLSLGSGFDPLCLRVAAHNPKVRFVEIDLPRTAQAKRAAAQQTGLSQPNLTILDVDLSCTSLSEALARFSGWSTSAATVVLAEGLLMYLPKQAVEEFLNGCHQVIGPQSRLIFSYLRSNDKGQPVLSGGRGRYVRSVMHLCGVPLLWGAQEGELPSFMQAHGYQLIGDPQRVDLQSRYLTSFDDQTLRYADFEYVAIAERLDH